MSKIYKIILLASDMLLVNLTLLAALFFHFNFTIPTDYLNLYFQQAIILVLIHFIVNMSFKLYQYMLRYITTREILYICSATLTACTLFFSQGVLTQSAFPIAVYPVHVAFLLLLTILSRFSYKFLNRVLTKFSTSYSTLKDFLNGIEKNRILILGAGDAASLVVQETKKNAYTTDIIVAALDDDRNKWKSKLHGVPIRGPLSDVSSFVKIHNIHTIILAMPSISRRRTSEILNTCSELNCTLKIFAGIPQAVSEGETAYRTRHVNIEDLLGRDEIMLDTHKIKRDISNHTILVTGGGGSIGSELCRQISAFAPKRLIIFDIYENNAYDIQNELLRNGLPSESLITIIGSIRDTKKLDEVFTTYKPSIVFHAAAHKHVPLMEFSPSEAIKNNVLGTLNVATAARTHKVKKFILISTDKAVNPTNVMGATKRMCEMIIQSIHKTTPHTDYVAVRFGNVLGSNGSVIPLFKRQLEAGGPLTVTHKDIIRYFMTIPEAVRLILQAMSFASGGEIFVLDMGSPVKILDLAENFIRLSGFEPYKDVDIVFTGLRPGEKLYEELLMEEEGMTETISEKIFIGKPSDMTFAEVSAHIAYLQRVLDEGHDIPEALAKVVPTYTISPNGSTKKAPATMSDVS